MELVGLLLWSIKWCIVFETKQTNYAYLAELSQQRNERIFILQFEFRLKAPEMTIRFVLFNNTNTTCYRSNSYTRFNYVISTVSLKCMRIEYLQLMRAKKQRANLEFVYRMCYNNSRRVLCSLSQ